jgi:hypothetical protein
MRSTIHRSLRDPVGDHVIERLRHVLRVVGEPR